MAEVGGSVTLVERNAKKAAFLREALRVSGGVGQVILADIGDSVDRFPPHIDCITARAVAPLHQLIGFAEPLLHPGAKALFLKGQDVEAELTEATKYWRLQPRLHASMNAARSYGEELRAMEDFSTRHARRNLVREAYMRRKIQQAIAEGFKPEQIVVVTGAFHASALGPELPPMTDEEFAKLRQRESKMTLMPYSFFKLSSQSGYGAGNHAPAYFEMVWNAYNENTAAGAAHAVSDQRRAGTAVRGNLPLHGGSDRRRPAGGSHGRHEEFAADPARIAGRRGDPAGPGGSARWFANPCCAWKSARPSARWPRASARLPFRTISIAS